MNAAPQGLPFVVDRRARDDARLSSIVRAIGLMGRRTIGITTVEQTWTEDKVASDIVAKAAVTPSSTAISQLRHTAIEPLATIAGPYSAFGQFVPTALNVSLPGLYGVTIPYDLAAGDTLSWPGESNPAQVIQRSLTSVTLTATKKVIGITTATREIFEHTSFEVIMRDLLSRQTALSFEKKMFSTDAATTAAPAGLLYNITPKSATAGGGDAAFVADMSALAGSVSAVGGNNLFFVAGPAAYAKILLRQPLFKWPLAPSAALADTTVVCINPPCVAIGGGLDPPRLDVSNVATVHLEDTTPLGISTGGATPSYAAPVRSLYQTDALAIRIIANIDWALRTSSGIAVVNSITW
jgi:hypothetical protein